MSKDFDATLSDALDLVARAAHTAGPTVARIRGRQRTVHQRIALSTASVVLVAVGATAAYFATSSNGGGTPHLTGGSPHVTASVTTTTPTAGSTASPTTSASTGTTAASSPASSSPATSSSSASSQSVIADPHQAVDAAWLTPAQMPFASTFQWTAMQASAQGTSPIGQQLTPTVFYVPKDATFQALTMCADPAKLLPRTIGAQHTEFTATTGTAGSQFIFFFTDAASAQQTFTWLQSQYTSTCLVTGSNVQVTKTGGDGVSSAAWLSVKKTSAGPVDMSPYNREYFVLRGSTIAYVSIESTATLPTSYEDAAQLSTIASHLCVYGGSCD
ncbi:hypothetical protein [Actinospica sp.]|uniref:hypothetical protein n=1 Tax=Actinospica sp. TaxID=1872142 RepID=UPI002C4521DA|nr:hypothetical protein [Actinospica sp.]HWG26452.1 hypothetical protein [Actinospica sp.]